MANFRPKKPITQQGEENYSDTLENFLKIRRPKRRRKVNKLLTLTAICVLSGTFYAQKPETTYYVGKDKDGDSWFLDTDLVVRPKAPADWLLVMPIYTRLPGRTLVFMFNVDCSDSTYQFARAFMMDTSGKVMWTRDTTTRWGRFDGYSGNAAKITCRVLGGGAISE